VLASRRRVFATSLHGIERRVAALEAYAEEVAEADARYAEVREIERLAAGSDELLDLLARTTADDLAVAKIGRLTDEAAVVASTFTKAGVRQAGRRARSSRTGSGLAATAPYQCDQTGELPLVPHP
jgi:hypothetical protein